MMAPRRTTFYAIDPIDPKNDNRQQLAV